LATGRHPHGDVRRAACKVAGGEPRSGDDGDGGDDDDALRE